MYPGPEWWKSMKVGAIVLTSKSSCIVVLIPGQFGKYRSPKSTISKSTIAMDHSDLPLIGLIPHPVLCIYKCNEWKFIWGSSSSSFSPKSLRSITFCLSKWGCMVEKLLISCWLCSTEKENSVQDKMRFSKTSSQSSISSTSSISK